MGDTAGEHRREGAERVQGTEVLQRTGKRRDRAADEFYLISSSAQELVLREEKADSQRALDKDNTEPDIAGQSGENRSRSPQCPAKEER